MSSDLNSILFWWLSLLFLSLLTLPAIVTIFKNYFDKGYIFAKISSAGLLTYLIFVLSSFKFLPFTNQSIFLLICLLLALNLYFLLPHQKYKKILAVFKKNYKTFIFQESLFLLILIIWSFVRGFAPQIEGLEKFMDWGFINSALRSKFLPPADMWFSGSTINYYYFGHLIFALLTKITSIDSAITYNLSIATVCALTFVSGLSITGNLVYFVKKNLKSAIIAGLISALLLTFGGNLHAVYKLAKINIQQNQKLVFSASAFNQASRSYWYPDATRFIGHDPETKDKTIHEFPLYSFVVADLHGHMNDIPIILFFIALLPILVSFKFSGFINWRLVLPSALILSWAYMTNAWDFLNYGLVFALLTFFYHLKTSKKTIIALTKTLSSGLLVIAFWYFFSLPFSLRFTPMMQGIKLADAHTPFYQLFVLYGGFWLICLPFFLYFAKSKKVLVSDLLVLSLITTATILIFLPELAYVKDIYIFEHRRSNTMFKLVYQAFILYSLSAGYVLYRLKNKIIYKLIFVLVFASHLLYPFFALPSYYGLRDYKGLWGLGFLKDSYPDNFAAINWIQANIDGQPIMLEAVGDSYTTFNHVSSATGLPTVEGWLVHEWLWRGGYDQPGARQADVKLIYESEDSTQTRQLLNKYNVDYIFVGAKEYEKYPDLNPDKFLDLDASLVFESGQTQIYKLPK